MYIIKIKILETWLFCIKYKYVDIINIIIIRFIMLIYSYSIYIIFIIV